MKAWRMMQEEEPADGWRLYPTGQQVEDKPDGHIIPLSCEDSELQECLDAHPEFHTPAERKLAEELAGENYGCPPDGRPCYDQVRQDDEVCAACWLAWAREEGK